MEATPGESGEGSQAANQVVNMAESPQKKKKVVRHTSLQLKVLKKYYEKKGMTNYKTYKLKKLVEEAAKKTELTPGQVKSWIGGRNKRANIRSGRSVRRKPAPLNPRKPSLKNNRYRLHMSEYLTGKDQTTVKKQKKLLKAANTAWKASNEKKGYLNKLDKKLKQHTLNVSVKNLTKNQKLYRVAKIVKKIKGYCKQLDKEMQWSSAFMTSNPGCGTDFTGNAFGKNIVKQNDFRLLRQFHVACGAAAGDFQPPREKKKNKAEEIKNLRMKLRTELNEKFYAATGIAQVSYQAIKEGHSQWTVVGWPDDLPFQNPSNFGQLKLKQLLAITDKISFIAKQTGYVGSVEDTGVQEGEEGDNEEESEGDGESGNEDEEQDVDESDEEENVNISDKEEDEDKSNESDDSTDESDEEGDVNESDKEEDEDKSNKSDDSEDESDQEEDVNKSDDESDKEDGEEGDGSDYPSDEESGAMKILEPLATGVRKKAKKAMKILKPLATGVRKKAKKGTTKERTYHAERLLKSRQKDGGRQYLVKWKNYPVKEASWEPIDNIMDPELIAQFYDKK